MSKPIEYEHLEVWLRMYEEQVRHARHHETLRSQFTNIVIAISAALVAFVATDNGDKYQSILGIFLVTINAYGLLMSLKHYERSRLHITVASRYRSCLSEAVPINDKKLNDERLAGREDHGKKFMMKFLIDKLRAYILWGGLHLLLIVLGTVLVFLR